MPSGCRYPATLQVNQQRASCSEDTDTFSHSLAVCARNVCEVIGPSGGDEAEPCSIGPVG
jgi:hypothetical protein